MSRVRRSALAALTVTAVAVLPAIAISPAYATTIDVSGLRLDFGNAVDEYILENGQINDPYLYENIATVDGTQIDAVVTITAMSDNSLGNYPHENISEAYVVALNDDNSEHVDVAGCYSNADYVTAYEAEQPYDFLGFNAPGSLKGGTEVEYIDGFEDDPEWEYTISTGLSLCDPGYTGEVDGYVQINVAFQVDGSPVTLNNVTINATDIDNEQEVTFWGPAPTTFTTSGADSLVTIQDYAATDDYVTFVGPAEGSVAGQEGRYVGEVTYDSVEEFDYTFQLVNGSSGSLQLAFDSYFQEEIAKTGVDAAPIGALALGALFAGSVAVIARRVRRNRA